jgi:predicted  nucleic acid-binding Zn-ribbon protein
MEAMVAERGAEMTEWNDGRLDDLSERVDRIETKMDRGFAEVREEFTAVNKKIDQLGQKVDSKLDRIETKIDDKFIGLHRMLFQASWGFALAVIGILGLIAAKL